MIPFIDLAAQQRRLQPRLDAAIAGVLAHGQYVMGPEVSDFEDALAQFCGAARALACANGTDALVLALMALGVGTGDAVFCPSFTFAATPEAIVWTGAEPVFVDIRPDTLTLDPAALEAAIAATRAKGRLNPTAVVAVDLFGQLADYPGLAPVCAAHDLALVSDNAQGCGATLAGRHPVAWARAASVSFFPAKPLGCYGDGGAVLTDDEALWERMDSLRIHGKAGPADLAGRAFAHEAKYLNARVGMNSRLDTLQAAILLVKLEAFAAEIAARNRLAKAYADGLPDGRIGAPTVIPGGVSTWAQYTIEHPDRDGLAAHLKGQGIPSAVYYPVPMHLQEPYRRYAAPGGLPVTTAKAERVLSLPMHPDLEPEVQARIIAATRGYNG